MIPWSLKFVASVCTLVLCVAALAELVSSLKGK
jgi:hypothetical protein